MKTLTQVLIYLEDHVPGISKKRRRALSDGICAAVDSAIAAEREHCAKCADAVGNQAIAAAIRARGDKGGWAT